MNPMLAVSVLDLIWSIIIVVFWFFYIWMIITVSGDILRRPDISGWLKSGWVLLILFLPLLGILLYIAFRPRVPAIDGEPHYSLSGLSSTDEIAKAQQLRNTGTITDEESKALKRKALG